MSIAVRNGMDDCLPALRLACAGVAMTGTSDAAEYPPCVIRWPSDDARPAAMELALTRREKGLGAEAPRRQMMRMDIVSIPGSRILEIARIAFATPDVDFLCFGESDQPSPASAHAAAVAALDAGATRYPDVRGLPELRCGARRLSDAAACAAGGGRAHPDHRLRHDRGFRRAGGDGARRRSRGSAQPLLAERRQRGAAAWRAGGRTGPDRIARRRVPAWTSTGWTRCSRARAPSS